MFETRTVIVSMLLGTIVTLVASIAPAIKATKVPPIAAVREGATLPPGRFAPVPHGDRDLGRRAVARAARLRAVRATASPPARGSCRMAVGVLGLFVGVALTASKLAAPLASALGRPFARIGGVSGLARPRERDAEPGADGVHRGRADDRARAGHDGGDAGQGPGRVRPRRAAPPGAGRLRGHLEERLGRVLPRGGRRGRGRTRRDRRVERPERAGKGRHGDEVRVDGIDPATIASVYTYDWVQGSNATLASLGRDGAIVRQKWATSHDVGVGDRITVVEPGRPAGASYVVRGIYTQPKFGQIDPVLGSIAISQQAFDCRLRAAPERVHVPERAGRRDPGDDGGARAGAGRLPGREGRDQARLGRGAGDGRRTSSSTCSTSCSPSR